MRNRNSKREQLLNEIAEAVFFKLLEEGVIDHNGQYVNEGWWDSTKKAARTAATVGGLALTTFLGGGKAQAQDVQAPDQTYQMVQKRSASGLDTIRQDSINAINTLEETYSNFVKGTGGKDYSRLFVGKFFKGVEKETLDSLFESGFAIQGSLEVMLPAGEKRQLLTQSGKHLVIKVDYNLEQKDTTVTLLHGSVPILHNKKPGESATLEELRASDSPLAKTALQYTQEAVKWDALRQIADVCRKAFGNDKQIITPQSYTHELKEKFKKAHARGYDPDTRDPRTGYMVGGVADAAFNLINSELERMGGTSFAAKLSLMTQRPELNPFIAAKVLPGIL